MLVFLSTFFSQSTASLERYKSKCEEVFLLEGQLAWFLSHLHLHVALNSAK